MTRVAFYAPLKPIDHPTASGDRRMARLFVQALELAGYDVEIASSLRTHDKKGDDAAQTEVIAQASAEIDRLSSLWRGDPPALWFTYHCYYKAPDLIGPFIAGRFGIPYVIAEASRASKRLGGPWDRFARHAEAAIDGATLLLAMTPHDRFALDRDATPHQRIVDFPPFLDAGPDPAPRTSSPTLRLLSVAMMRQGDKLASYQQLAAALAFLKGDWTLDILGDGPARAQVMDLFAPFGSRIRFTGSIEETALRFRYETADILVWPGVNEAYGMVYLEAQAAGTPVVAQDWPGPRAIIGQGSRIVARDDPHAFARAVDAVATDDNARRLARAHCLAYHTLDAAAERLKTELEKA